MKFTGQIRVPEVDHPGVPATFVVDDNQAEVVLEGESLGRWSLFDVHVTRLVSNAFQVELADEEITFLADEPVDFAYKGVEHMAEVWARYKTMTVPRRVVAVRRSRKGTSPSRIQEFQGAMLENLRSEEAGESTMLAGEITASGVPLAPSEAEPLLEPVVENSEIVTPVPVIPLAAEPDDLEQVEAPSVEAEEMAAERKALVEERAVLEEQRRSLEQSLAKAELLEKERLEAAQADMDRIEGEKRALEDRHEKERLAAERLEGERREAQELEAERLNTERSELHQLEADRVEREREQEEALETQKRIDAELLEKERDELAHLEAERVERERLESERLEAARVELEEVEHARAEAARIEMEKLEKERLNLESLEADRLKREQAEASRAEKERLATEKREAKRLKKEEAAAATSAAKAVPESNSQGPVAEVLGTSAEGDLPENSKELIVDLGAFEQGDSEGPPQPQSGPEPALAGVPEKAGIMGAVKSAFGRSGKNHIHEFTEAPGGIGMVRYICRDCGYVSISSSD